MISKHLLSVLAVIFALVMISPSMMAVTLDESEILVDMESAHADEYDETVNIADDTSASNYASWNPAPQGLWIGSSTQESKYQLGVVTSANSTLVMTWHVKFTSSQIMSGVSEFTLRLPIYIDASVQNIGLYILAVDTVQSTILTGATISYEPDANQKFIYIRRSLDPTDVSVMDGNDVYVRDNRMYLNVVAPINPGQIYTFQMIAIYAIDANPTMYIAPNDVANDGIINALIGYKIPAGPGVFTENDYQFDFDWGASYDMRGGLGGGVTSQTLYMNAGDEFLFCYWAPYAPGINGHHTLTMPFYTASGKANFSVTVTHRGSGTVVLDAPNTTYEQVILASDAHAHNVSSAGSSGLGYMFLVSLVAGKGQWVTFYLKTTPLASYIGTGVNSTRYSQINPTYVIGNPFVMDADRYIGFVPISSYLVCPAQITTPLLGAAVDPTNTGFTSVFEKGVFNGVYLFLAKVFQSGVEFVAETFDITNPGEAVVFVATMASGGVGVAWWIVSTLTDMPSPIDVYRQLLGNLNNVLDIMWDSLKAIGSFLWSIGEYVYDALTWLAEQIVQYGSYLLGLLIIAAALLIFFFPIHYQLKLWTSALLLAQGKVAQAQKGVEEVATDIGNKASTIGKVL